MKRVFFIFLISLALTTPAQACVGRILSIGAVDTPMGRVLAETLALLIVERTGTTVNTSFYPGVTELYQAVTEKKVGILVENAHRGLTVVKAGQITDRNEAYSQAKTAYQANLNLIWMDPFAFINTVDWQEPTTTATVVSLDVMTDFPGLQRLINKLAAKLDDQAYAEMTSKARAGDKPAKIARDFLEAKKLI